MNKIKKLQEKWKKTTDETENQKTHAETALSNSGTCDETNWTVWRDKKHINIEHESPIIASMESPTSPPPETKDLKSKIPSSGHETSTMPSMETITSTSSPPKYQYGDNTVSVSSQEKSALHKEDIKYQNTSSKPSRAVSISYQNVRKGGLQNKKNTKKLASGVPPTHQVGMKTLQAT